MRVPQDIRTLRDKTAWVTGASRGIGRAVALALANAGAQVVLGARDVAGLEQVATAINATGGTAHAVALDVASVESCEAFGKRAVEIAGPPTILVNNAGVGVFRPVDGFQPDEFEKQFRVNVFGTFHMTRIAVPFMREQGDGHLVNVSSLAGESQAYMGTGYFASKHAVNGFTKSLMLDVREDNIRVTLVCPGSVDTRFHHDSHPGSHRNRDQTWMVEPEHVADSIVHVLLAPATSCISRVDIRPTRVPS